MILINGEVFNNEEFHNGEVIFRKPELSKYGHNVIEMQFKDNRDIANLMFIITYLNIECAGVSRDLIMRYCPYERMDREINDQLFSMKYFAKIIASMRFECVYILDPHSSVCVNCLEYEGVNVRVLDLEYYIKRVVEDFKPDYICYPDKGAHSKYPDVLRSIKLPTFYGNKVRALSSDGHIIDYELVNAPDIEGKKVIIIDDICCLGGTAYEAATKMKELGAKEVAFYISHCEDGIFVGNILKKEPEKTNGNGEYVIDKVYTADTMKLSNTHENITIIK